MCGDLRLLNMLIDFCDYCKTYHPPCGCDEFPPPIYQNNFMNKQELVEKIRKLIENDKEGKITAQYILYLMENDVI